MTDLELEVTKLRWRVETFEALFVNLCALLFEESAKVPRRAFAHAFLETIEAAKRRVRNAPLPPERSEEEWAALLRAFDQEMEKMKGSVSFFDEDPSQ